MARAATDRFFRTLPLSMMAAAAAGAALWGAGWTEQADAMPWLVSLGFVGLPHGAADLAIARRTRARGATLRLAAVYVAFMVGVLALFLAMPLLVIAVFAAVSVWHFGMAHADGEEPPVTGGFTTQAVAAVARGGLVLGVPMARWPDATATVAGDVVRLVTGQPVSAEPGLVRVFGIALTVLVIAAFLAEIVGARRRPEPLRRTMATALELSVIAALGLTTAPLFSVGVYFLCWHGWRQMRLLMPIVAGAAPTDAASLARGLAAVHFAGWPLLLPTWLALATAWWILSSDHSARDLALLSLAFYVVVTPSHDLLIDLMRHRMSRLTEATSPRARPEPTMHPRLHRQHEPGRRWARAVELLRGRMQRRSRRQAGSR
ncbi:MAG: Brp/Blh family beta-carotene 15,15'-dioxygenase [Planctomycetia bacterium]